MTLIEEFECSRLLVLRKKLFLNFLMTDLYDIYRSREDVTSQYRQILGSGSTKRMKILW